MEGERKEQSFKCEIASAAGSSSCEIDFFFWKVEPAAFFFGLHIESICRAVRMAVGQGQVHTSDNLVPVNPGHKIDTCIHSNLHRIG